MTKVVEIRNAAGGLEGMFFDCPGCSMGHLLNVDPHRGRPCWEFNGNMESPTFRPSVLARWSFGANHEKRVCHSFVTGGNIQFLNDCTHALAGQTVPLPEIDECDI